MFNSKENLEKQIHEINKHLIELYDKVNMLYDILNNVFEINDGYDLKSPYHIEIKRMIESYKATIEMQQENKKVFEDMLKEME